MAAVPSLGAAARSEHVAHSVHTAQRTQDTAIGISSSLSLSVEHTLDPLPVPLNMPVTNLFASATTPWRSLQSTRSPRLPRRATNIAFSTAACRQPVRRLGSLR